MSNIKFSPIPEDFGESELDVFPGQLIVAKSPPQLGRKGRTVTGEDIPPQPGEELEVIPGRNICVSQDGTRFFAMDFGKVVWEKNKVNVEKILEIKENVDTFVEFSGSINIHGSISDKVNVTAAGDINVKGNIGAAEVSAGGNIIVGQDITNAKIISDGNVSANAAKESSIIAAGTVTIGEGITKCNIEADRIITHTGRKGLILGGEIKAKKLVTAKKIGQEGATVGTSISVAPGGKVYVEGVIYPKVTMMLGKRAITPKKPIKKVFYNIDPSGNITQKPYEEPVVEEEQVTISTKPQLVFPELPISVILEATSIEEARKKGAELLQLPVEETDAKIIEEKLGTSKIVVFKKGVIGPWSPQEWDDLYGPRIDGTFSFENRVDGLYLLVVHSQGGGKRITAKEVIEDTIAQKFKDIDIAKIEEVFKKRIKRPVRIGPRQYLRGKIEVEISEDKSTATVKIIPPKLGGMLIKVEDIINALHQKGVRYGINKQRIVEMLYKGEFNVPVVVAEAKLPLPGETAYLAYQYGKKSDGNLLIGDEAIPGQLLGMKIPPVKGAPGVSVTGEEIPGLPGRDIPLAAGKGAFLEDNQRCFAATFGKVTWNGFQVEVEQIVNISHDVEHSIDTPGKVIIQGNVKEGVKINAGGDVVIHGSIEENAEVVAKGKISVTHEIVKAKVKAVLDISATVIKESEIECDAAVNVKDGILDSRVVAENVVLSAENKGLIVGGEIAAKYLVHAKVIGKETAPPPTTISIGENGKLSIVRILYPKVNIVFGKRSMTIKKPVKKVTFKVEKASITTKEYEPPEVKPKKMEIEPVTPVQRSVPRSVIVPGYSIEEAKQKAAELLNIPVIELDGEPLPRERTNVPAIRIFPKGIEGPWLEDWEGHYEDTTEDEIEEEDTDKQDRDGTFKLINKREGLYLYIKPPVGKGKPVTTNQVLAKIEELGYVDVDNQKIIEACNTQPTEPVRIGLMQFTKELSGTFEIIISEDKQEVYLKIIPADTGRVLLKPEDIIRALERKGIIAGIMEDEIKRMLEEKEYNVPVLVAASIPPSKGEPGKFLYKIGGE